MKRLVPYLIFPGTCQEALVWYAECLGGEIVELRRFSDSPLKVPPEHRDRIFDSTLQAGELVLRASDGFPGRPLEMGTNFSLFVSFSEASEQTAAFNALGREGETLMPLQNDFGMVEDRFGIRWMLALDRDG